MNRSKNVYSSYLIISIKFNLKFFYHQTMQPQENLQNNS